MSLSLLLPSFSFLFVSTPLLGCGGGKGGGNIFLSTSKTLTGVVRGKKTPQKAFFRLYSIIFLSKFAHFCGFCIDVNHLKAHLRILEPELLRQLLPVRLRDVLLYLEPLLQTLALVVGKDGAAEHAAAGLAWKYCNIFQGADVKKFS